MKSIFFEFENTALKRIMSSTGVKEPLKIVIFLGSTRNNRMVERLATYVKAIVENKGSLPIIMGK